MALLRRDNHLLHNVSYKDVSVFFYYYIEYSISLGILHAEARRFSYSSMESELCSSTQCLLVHLLKELQIWPISNLPKPTDVHSNKQPNERLHTTDTQVTERTGGSFCMTFHIA